MSNINNTDVFYRRIPCRPLYVACQQLVYLHPIAAQVEALVKANQARFDSHSPLPVDESHGEDGEGDSGGEGASCSGEDGGGCGDSHGAAVSDDDRAAVDDDDSDGSDSDYIEDGKADRDHQEPQSADAAAVNLKLVAEFHVLHARVARMQHQMKTPQATSFLRSVPAASRNIHEIQVFRRKLRSQGVSWVSLRPSEPKFISLTLLKSRPYMRK